jgi:hypothetical protein
MPVALQLWFELDSGSGFHARLKHVSVSTNAMLDSTHRKASYLSVSRIEQCPNGQTYQILRREQKN